MSIKSESQQLIAGRKVPTGLAHKKEGAEIGPVFHQTTGAVRRGPAPSFLLRDCTHHMIRPVINGMQVSIRGPKGNTTMSGDLFEGHVPMICQ